MKTIVSFLSFSAVRGGAAKAAARFYKALQATGLFETTWAVIEIGGPVRLAIPSSSQRWRHRLLWLLSAAISCLQRSESPAKHSLNLFGSDYAREVIRLADIVHLHWFNNETLAVRDFSLLDKKCVVTLHDEWLYCGAEHHAMGEPAYRRVTDGYLASNKDVRWIDLNRLIWCLKMKHIYPLKGIIYTVPSVWMQERALASRILRGKDVRVVPNPVDPLVFRRVRSDLRSNWRVAEDVFVITFGAVGGSGSFIKGYDLLLAALKIFRERHKVSEKLLLVSFGGRKKGSTLASGYRVLDLGRITSEESLAQIYSSSSIVVVPSRVESFGQVAAESLCCETPVVAFDYSGLRDVIQHKVTGFLAEPHSPEALADGIEWLYFMSQADRAKMGTLGRKDMARRFSPDVVGKVLLGIYQEINKKRGNVESIDHHSSP